MSEIVSERKLTPAQTRIIQAILDSDRALNISELAAKIGISKGSLSNMVKVLNELGVVNINELSTGEKTVTLAEGAELAEISEDGSGKIIFRGAAPLPPSPKDKLDEIMEMFGVSQIIRKRVTYIVANNPQAGQSPDSLFNILIALGVNPNISRLITNTYFGYQQTLAYDPTLRIPLAPPPPPPQPYSYQSYFYQTTNPPQPYSYQSYYPQSYNQPPPQPYSQSQSYPNPPQQQSQQSQPIIIKTGELRKVRRPVLAKDGTPLRDKDGNVIYEEAEEPLTIVANPQSSSLEWLGSIFSKLFDHMSSSNINPRLDEEREKRFQAELKAVKTEVESEIKTFQNSIAKVLEDLGNKQNSILGAIKDMLEKHQQEEERRFERMQYEQKIKEVEREYEQRIKESEGKIGEPAIVAVAREMRKGLESIAGRIQAPVGFPIPAYQYPAQQPNPQEQLAAINRMRQRLQQTQ